MGTVVKLKPRYPADAATRRLKRLEAKVAELKEHNKVLIRLLRDPYNKNVKLQNARLVLINERLRVDDVLCCIPARSRLFCPCP